MDRTQCATSDVTVEPDSFSNSQDGHARGAGVSGGAALISVASAKVDSSAAPCPASRDRRYGLERAQVSGPDGGVSPVQVRQGCWHGWLFTLASCR